MAETHATRRSFIEMASVLAPIAVLGGCSGSGGSAVVATLLNDTSFASGKTEAQIWLDSVGKSFRIGGATGPIYASLTSVVAQPSGGVRPADVRQDPLLLSFTLDAGYDTLGDETYFLDRTMGNESRLFMQRGTTANGRPELLALLN